MSVDSSLLSLIARRPSTLVRLQQAGVTAEYFVEPWDAVFKYVEKQKRLHGEVPSPDVITARYDDVDLHPVRSRDLASLTHDIVERKKFMDLADILDETINNATRDNVDESISQLQARISELGLHTGAKSTVDFFSEEMRERIMQDYRARRRGQLMGIPTGLARLDYTIGGLQKKWLFTTIARPGVGKSWITLLFTASAVIHGYKVLLFPLEMTVEETAYRLYTLFSSRMLGQDGVLKNNDLLHGQITPFKLNKFLRTLNDKFPGQLIVGDVGSMSDPYTVDRVEAEQRVHQADMIVVDYITLMKAPGVGRDGGEDHTTIRYLSNGMKGIAQRNDCVCAINAQVNRESLKNKGVLLPRLEHIGYGDAIGQDSDGVMAAARRGPHIYYALVKHRHGPEIGKTRARFNVNEGDIQDTTDQDRSEDDDE